MIPLAACPFCGYTEIEVCENLGLYLAACPECEATGPTWETATGAANLWNERTSLMWDSNGLCEETKP
jgi:Lar family restriction alleviation protein